MAYSPDPVEIRGTHPEAGRAKVFAELEDVRRYLREHGRPDLEDAVLDVMDRVTGWCSPHMRL